MRSREASLVRADGVVLARFPDQHHPVRSTKVASGYFLDVAATPPRLRRGMFARLLFGYVKYVIALGQLEIVEPRIRPTPHLVDIENLSQVISEVFHNVINGL